MEILKRDIRIDKKIGKESNQILIEGDIIVSDFKPDIDKVLEANAVAYIDNKDILNDKVSIKGNLDINVLFMAKNDEKGIYSMQTTYPINDFLNVENIDKSMTVFATCGIANLDYKLINDRKVSFRAILDVEAEVMGKEEFEAVSDIEGLASLEMKKTNINVNKLVCAKFDRFNIKDEIEIASSRPNIKEILDVALNIINKDTKVSEGKIAVSGDVKASILYKGEEDGDIITYFEQDIPFNGSVAVEGATEDMLADVYLDIQEKNIQILEDNDGEDRVIGIDTHIGCNIKVTYDEEMEVLEDAYSLNKAVELERYIQAIPALVCKNKNQATIKEVIQIDKQSPNILQILRVSGKPILDNVSIEEDLIIAEGVVECKVLYITNDDQYPINSLITIVPYTQTIDAKGANENTMGDIKVNLEHIGVNMLSEKDLELRCAVNFDTYVTAEKDLSFVMNISLNDMDMNFLDGISSITVYVVQKGDTLWSLAKKFNTTVGDILKLNDIENPDLIYPGQKLLILKKVC